MDSPFKEGESYYLLQCGWPCEMVFIEETTDEFIFQDGLSPWGGDKVEVLDMYKRKVLTQDKDAIQRQIDYMNRHAVPFDDVPDSWLDRCSGDGHKRLTDDEGNKVYADSGNIVQDEGYRPCAKCGEFPNENGDDACIQNLGKVINACCGHGVNKGYIMFDDGRIIEGHFTIRSIWEE